ncbi:MAG TPA: type II CAAX endopeptidase family protein [Dehalococcoidia bacterium]|nr:type II CAAX endopeptidase family protein [Dehalococcoidia bacterium]
MDITAGSSPPPGEPVEVAGRRIDWTPRDVVLGIMAFLGAFLLVPLIPFVILLVIFDDDESRGFLLSATALNILVYGVIIAVAAYFTFGKYGGGWSRLGFGRPRWPTLWWGLAAFAGAYLASVAWGLFVQLFESLEQSCDDQVPLYIRDDPVVLAALGLSAIVFAPVAEETFFRGFLFPGIARFAGVAAGVVLSGVLFGLAHLVGNPTLWKSAAQFSLIGIVFALAYWKSGNLLSVVLAHMLFNTLGVIAIVAVECEPS